eukprot:s615_g13.t1
MFGASLFAALESTEHLGAEEFQRLSAAAATRRMLLELREAHTEEREPELDLILEALAQGANANAQEEAETAVGDHSDQPCLQSLFIPNWSCLKADSKVTVVVKDVVWGNNAGVGRLVPGEQMVRLTGLVPPHAAGATKVTVLDACFLSSDVGVDLALDEHSRVLCHLPLCVDHVMNLTELCSGAGLSSVGFKRAGFHHKCAVERQPKLAELHTLLHPGVPVVCADITHDATVGLVFDQISEPSSLMVGFSCQPFSRGGLQQGQHDSRASSLPGAIRMTHLLQAPALFLECVSEAQDNPFVKAHVQALCTILGYHVVECNLKLEDTWAACRHRWWMVATHPNLGPVSIPPFPKGSPLVVRDLIPYVKRWPHDDEVQLLLSPEEIAAFQITGQPLRSHNVKPDAKLPTALHSWGGQTRACECECRSSGFSEGLLKERGLFAQLFQLPPEQGQPGHWRHLHVLEVSLLNGVPLDLPWSSNQRLNLCAIGQMAAPMQSLWLAASFVRQVQSVFSLQPLVDPLTLLNNLKHDMLCQAKQLYPSLPKMIPADVDFCQVVISDPEHGEWTLSFHPSATVKDLILAHSRLHDLPTSDVWVRDCDGDLVAHELPLASFGRVVLGRSCVMFPEHAGHVLGSSVSVVVTHEPMVTQLDGEADMVLCEDDDGHPPAIASDPFLGPGLHDATVQPLLDLQPSQLLTMLPPLVLDLDLACSMRQQQISTALRFRLLDLQGKLWSDDEMWWQMQVLPLDPPDTTVVLDPLLATSWLVTGHLDSMRHWISQQPAMTRIATAVLTSGHWMSCIWVVKSQLIEIHIWEHDEANIEVLNPLHSMFCAAFQVLDFRTTCNRRSFGKNLCGAAAIAFLQHRLNGLTLPDTEEKLQFAADSLREDFRFSQAGVWSMSRPWCWGEGLPELSSIVSGLLQQHGVPQNAAGPRAKLIIQSLGHEPVQTAMKGVAPWRTLKSLANQQTPPFQLVLQDELTHATQDRRTKPAKAKGQGKSKQQPVKPVDIDPARLILPEDTFRTVDDLPVAQIPLSHVGPLATGVALVSYSDALPFLQSGQTLTSKCLALLVLNCPDELVTDLPWASVRFAAKCSVNQQPVLLTGLLVQLGHTVIAPYFKHDSPAVSDVPVACARITVFADQWPHDWESFSDHPFKQILAKLEPLQACRVQSCSCDKWHQVDSDHHSEPLLDVFRRQFFNDSGRPTKASLATHFSVQIRYLKAQEDALLKLSGHQGLYIEPRLPDASSVSDEFQVVWLPQLSFAAAQHQSQCEALSTGLARSGKRYGLRVPAKHFQHVFQKLKPEGQFLTPGTRQSWHCGPFPYGSDRKSISKVFGEWNWQARPLQPAKPITGGVMWLVQSVTDPPQTVYNLPHGQVVVSKCDSVRAGLADSGSVVGPQNTVDLCATSSEVDPWLARDPWQKAVSQMPKPQAQPVGPPVATQLQEIEDRLAKSILDKLPQSMETDVHENRIQLLEQQMQHLAGRHQALESTVTEHHHQNTAQLQSLQAQMMSQMEVQRNAMSNMFDEQMFVFWLVLLASLFMGVECRIGEAKKPGPAVSQDCQWSLGVCNPSGLPGKSVLLSGIQADVVCVSETHLTKVGRSMLLASLKSHSNYAHVVTGAPLATRVNSHDAGQYSGVAVVSRVPTRALCANWPPDLYDTGRVQITGSMVNNVWITGGVAYGYPQSKSHPNALERTSLMLEFLVDHLLSVASGPRFLAGDFNHPMHQLGITQRLQQLGWREAQDVEFLRSGLEPQATCKGRTRVDMLWLSPEMLSSFVQLQVETDRFPDHAVLKATFQVGNPFAVRYLWPSPSPVPWNNVSCPVPLMDFSVGSPTDLYAQFWKSAESHAKQALGDSWTYCMQGRGQRTQTTKRRGWAVPPRKGRSCDHQPEFHGYNVHHARWIKQLRRLHNYHRWSLSHFGSCTSSQALHGLFLWKSVLQSSGFRPSFAQWWTSRCCAGLQDPNVIPTQPPPPDVACLICEAFHGEVRFLERQLSAAKKASRVAKHETNPNQIYKDTRRPLPEPVTSLLDTVQAVVTEVDLEDSAIDFEPPVQFDPSKPVLLDDKPVRIVHATEDRLYLDEVSDFAVQATVKQVKPVGALDEVFAAFHTQWRERWCKHDNIPHSHWTTLVDFAKAHMPHHPVQHLVVTPALLRAEVAAKKPHAATGMDGVSRLDILQSDEAMLKNLCQVFQRAEQDGAWPLQVMTGRVASLAKREGAAGTQDYRPITVFSILYRAYSSLQARKMLNFASEWCHPDIHGNRKYHQTAHLWRTIATSIQEAYDQRLSLSGLTADIEKCYNCLPRWPILAAAVQCGTPAPLMTAWAGGLAAMVRRFKVRDSFSEGFTTSTGLAEGCGLSCFGMLLLDDVMHRWISAQFPAIRPLSFVDNWDFLTWNPQAAEQQLDLLQFTTLADLTVDMAKTFA